MCLAYPAYRKKLGTVYTATEEKLLVVANLLIMPVHWLPIDEQYCIFSHTYDRHHICRCRLLLLEALSEKIKSERKPNSI